MLANIPRHIAIIMDGNGRWARRRQRPRIFGHEHGVETARNIVLASAERGVKTLTLFAFSIENQKRPRDEVIYLTRLFARSLEGTIDKWLTHQIRLRFVGALSFFSKSLRQRFYEVETRTGNMQKMLLNIAVNYTGRWDILNAVRKAVAVLPTDIKELNEKLLSAQLLVDDVDLLIRTGGEQRISNFMLWQSAYAELYFSDSLWPDFTVAELDQAIAWYAQRERRFGHISAPQ